MDMSSCVKMYCLLSVETNIGKQQPKQSTKYYRVLSTLKHKKCSINVTLNSILSNQLTCNYDFNLKPECKILQILK